MLNRAGQSGRARGIIYAVIGTMFWGFSGAAAQYAFGDLHLNPLWLVGVRLFGAGALLLLWFGLQQPRALLKLWTNPKRAILMVVFALLGMIPSQLTYFMAIQYGNAATATVLQFTGPLFIVVYLACANRQ
jgi:drug/metabolite transporter (DMT)-like permease